MSNGGLEITTVSLCQNMCTYCPQQLLKTVYGPKEYMTLETFETCLSKVPKNIDILFAGFAEPFLNPLASQMIKMSVEQKYLVNLYTTLVGLRETDIEILTKLKLNCVVLHLPDDDGDMSCKINDDYINNLLSFINTVGYNSAHAYGNLHYKLQGLVNCTTQPKQVLHTRSNNNKKMIPLPRKSGKIACDVILRHNREKYNHNVLLPNGNVVLCCMDYGLQHQFGNLLYDKYEDLFQSENYNNLMLGLEDGNQDILCRTCSEARNV